MRPTTPGLGLTVSEVPVSKRFTDEENHQILGLLIGLGATESEVARSLARDGFKGAPGSFYGCPIAVFLRSRTGNDDLYVDADRVYYADRDGAITDSIRLPPAIVAFISRFDAGEFRDLDTL